MVTYKTKWIAAPRETSNNHDNILFKPEIDQFKDVVVEIFSRNNLSRSIGKVKSGEIPWIQLILKKVLLFVTIFVFQTKYIFRLLKLKVMAQVIKWWYKIKKYFITKSTNYAYSSQFIYGVFVSICLFYMSFLSC